MRIRGQEIHHNYTQVGALSVRERSDIEPSMAAVKICAWAVSLKRVCVGAAGPNSENTLALSTYGGPWGK